MSVESNSYPHFFRAGELGKSLHEVAVDVIHMSQERVTSRWFHSPYDVDLFIWSDSREQIIKQQVTFYGQVVEWNVVEGVKTGLIIEEESSEGGRRKNSSEIIQFDNRAQRAPIEQALELCRAIEALTGQDREKLLANFAESPTDKTYSPEEFVARFGAFLERPKARPRLAPWRTWLKQISHWFKS